MQVDVDVIDEAAIKGQQTRQDLKRGNCPVRNDREKLEKILECIEWVQEYAKSGKNNFLADHKTQDAMIRNCQIVGEAVKGLSNELRLNTPEVDWRSPARFRDKITHDYFDINLEQVLGNL